MSGIRWSVAVALLASGVAAPLSGQTKLNDLEMAHVAVTASNIDIAYAHLALAFSTNEAIRNFAETMVRDHSAVNGQVVALAKKLGVTARDNPMSRQLVADATATKDRLATLRGAAFDRAYVENELAYHRAVNAAVADQFIPAIQNAEVKAAFQAALGIFRQHERHAGELAKSLGGSD
ncbi:MAG: DUF4142 domain-containing protein [Gemmatimonadales bacterium]